MKRISLQNVSVTLGTSPIINEITTTIEPSKFIGLVGPNGAGKTTLLRAINGRLTPSTGTVTLGTNQTTDLSARELGQLVATVPQETTLPFDFTVRELVEMGRMPHRRRFSVRDPDRDQIDRALERTNTIQFADRTVTEISGGERQRVLLARALAQTTPILLLDEPTANLDINHQIQTLGLVRELVDENKKTIIAAIHDLDLAARYCDELFLLENGRLTATGFPDAVLSSEQLSATFDTTVAVTTNPITGSPAVTALYPQTDDNDIPIHVLGGGDPAIRVLTALSSYGYTITTGPLRTTDPAVPTANHHATKTITSPPHSPYSPTSIQEAKETIGNATCTILPNIQIGEQNRELLTLAAAAPSLIMIEPDPIEKRIHGLDTKHDICSTIRDHARVISSTTELQDAINEATNEPPGQPIPSTPNNP